MGNDTTPSHSTRSKGHPLNLEANEDVISCAKSRNWLQKRFVEGKGIKVVKKGLPRLVENRLFSDYKNDGLAAAWDRLWEGWWGEASLQPALLSTLPTQPILPFKNLLSYGDFWSDPTSLEAPSLLYFHYEGGVLVAHCTKTLKFFFLF